MVTAFKVAVTTTQDVVEVEVRLALVVHPNNAPFAHVSAIPLTLATSNTDFHLGTSQKLNRPSITLLPLMTVPFQLLPMLLQMIHPFHN